MELVQMGNNSREKHAKITYFVRLHLDTKAEDEPLEGSLIEQFAELIRIFVL